LEFKGKRQEYVIGQKKEKERRETGDPPVTNTIGRTQAHLNISGILLKNGKQKGEREANCAAPQTTNMGLVRKRGGKGDEAI